MGLQFSWIEANLLGFFLADVRNSRGKFDEIKEKFAINPAPIASQSSLNAGGGGDHDDLEIFLKIRLIPSRIDQKFKNNEEIHGVLKGKLAQKSWAVDAFMGANLRRRGSSFRWAASWHQIRAESAPIWR